MQVNRPSRARIFIDFSKDVAEIAKYLSWHSNIGDDFAQVLIDKIQEGKYGSREGIWVQWSKQIEIMESKLNATRD